ncbi:MAG: glycoside hydrolase family 3 C-terminal domain-containing protein [Actinomycetota bacterium]|nr:glycoside hydrolase family 3 C-terminal domain-containing protein [Actinomycetota bacterium]
MSERIEKLVTELTLDEKAALTAGVDLWHGPGAERLGLPALKVTDGPSGARGEQWSGRPSANFPCGTALGATWNTELVHEVGKRLGVEARRKQAHALLAPTVNIHRHPLAGRNFECYSEDPVLSARMAVAYITGVQSQGVGCTVKHFVANDSEFERMTISSEVDERTLREISLVPFEAAVREAGTWALMTAYNRVNGPYCSEHAELITMLRDEWQFEGLIMSDWYGTHSTVPAAHAGLDLEMPGPPQWFGLKLAAAVRAGEVSETALDDKVHRVLSLMERTGRLDDERPQEVCIDDPIDRAIARRAARESFVLLQNQGAALPISAAVKSIAVIGPNADATVIQGGGSARVTPHPPVSPLAGLRARFGGAGVEVAHERGCYSFKRTPVLDDPVLRGPLAVQYYAGRERAGDAVYEEDSARGLFTFIGPVGHGVPEEFSLKVRGTVVAPETGEWTFTLVQVGRAKLSIDGEVIVDNWNPNGRSDAFMGYGSAEAAGTTRLSEGEPHTLEVEFVPPRGLGGLEVGCRPPAPPDLMDRAVALARRADAVVCVVGTDNDWESEGHDRESMALPAPQDELVRAIAAANPNTVVVVNAASPIEMPWAGDVAAITQAWFPGEEWGNALADVLSGDVSPSGKLPTTIPVRLEDTPAFTNYPGERGQVRYGEGLFVGYRWYDARRIEPRFCFGHGLSYTTFELAPPTWDGDAVHIRVTNTGSMRGAETVQCYVHDSEASVARPQQELKAFAKVWLDPGESGDLILGLDERAFAFWDIAAHAWTVEPGEFELRVGTSSRAIAHRLTIERS